MSWGAKARSSLSEALIALTTMPTCARSQVPQIEDRSWSLLLQDSDLLSEGEFLLCQVSLVGLVLTNSFANS